jgi:hypothetical protein
MEILTNIAAGISGVVMVVVGVYSIVAIWNDDLV